MAMGLGRFGAVVELLTALAGCRFPPDLEAAKRQYLATPPGDRRDEPARLRGVRDTAGRHQGAAAADRSRLDTTRPPDTRDSRTRYSAGTVPASRIGSHMVGNRTSGMHTSGS